MINYNVIIRATNGLLSDEYQTIISVEIVGKMHGRHTVASAYQLVEKREVRLCLFFVDFWTGKSLSIYSVDFQKVSGRLLELNFVDVWIEKI
jgi:hypothetical protein